MSGAPHGACKPAMAPALPNSHLTSAPGTCVHAWESLGLCKRGSTRRGGLPGPVTSPAGVHQGQGLVSVKLTQSVTRTTQSPRENTNSHGPCLGRSQVGSRDPGIRWVWKWWPEQHCHPGLGLKVRPSLAWGWGSGGGACARNRQAHSFPRATTLAPAPEGVVKQAASSSASSRFQRPRRG